LLHIKLKYKVNRLNVTNSV